LICQPNIDQSKQKPFQGFPTYFVDQPDQQSNIQGYPIVRMSGPRQDIVKYWMVPDPIDLVKQSLIDVLNLLKNT
jgi:hypothetical protein